VEEGCLKAVFKVPPKAWHWLQSAGALCSFLSTWQARHVSLEDSFQLWGLWQSVQAALGWPPAAWSPPRPV